MDRYIALLHAAGDGYGISFPDFPGCVSGGANFAETLANGARALRFHVEGMQADGDRVRKPRSFESIRQAPEIAAALEGAVVATVPLLPSRGRAVRIQVSIDDQLLRAIDTEAERRGVSRSAFLSEAAQSILSPA